MVVAKKILVFGFPGSGHLNPIIPLLRQISSEIDVKIIFYLTDSYKEKIESIGPNVEYRSCIPHKLYLDFEHKLADKCSETPLMLGFQLDIADEQMINIAREIDQEQADLIIYDFLAIYFKWAIKFYKKCFNRELTTLTLLNPLPPLVCFSPSFQMNEPIFPNSFERSLFIKIDFKMGREELAEFSLVSVCPELQPRSHLFDEEHVKFIGSTSVSDLVEDKRSDQEPFKSLFVLHPALNPSLATFDLQKKLIYVSLGTVFNNKTEIYGIILDAFRENDENLTVVISTGENVFNRLTETRFIPPNVHLVKSAPQIDLLRRASLFITHSGMNSTSESVHFGVPMICIPIAADQPLVANRIANDLGLGIMFDKDSINSKELSRAIEKILNDKSFFERAQIFSQYSRKYKGEKIGSGLISDFLKLKSKQ